MYNILFSLILEAFFAMFSQKEINPYLNREIKLINGPLNNRRIKSSVFLEFLNQQEYSEDIYDFYLNYQEERRQLKSCLDNYKKYTLERKKYFIDWYLYQLSVPMRDAILNFLEQPNDERLKIASLLKSSEKNRKKLVLKHSEYTEILLAPDVVRDHIAMWFEKRNDSDMMLHVNKLISCICPKLPFDEVKYHEITRIQNHYSSLFQSKYQLYVCKLIGLKLQILNYVLICMSSILVDSGLFLAIQQLITHFRTKLTLISHSPQALEDDFDQFVDIEETDFSICEIEHIVNRSTSFEQDQELLIIHEIELAANEELCPVSGFELKF